MAIEWGPERPHDGSSDCPADARDVPCMILYTPDDFCGANGRITGGQWLWGGVTAYRIPIVAPSEADLLRAELDAQRKITAKLMRALEEYAEWIVDFGASGDNGFWDGEKMPQVIKARAALKTAKDAEK